MATYFREALESIIGKRPPAYARKVNSSRDLSDDDIMRLQDWCIKNRRPKWATGLSMIEAADFIVESAIENANIPRPAKKESEA